MGEVHTGKTDFERGPPKKGLDGLVTDLTVNFRNEQSCYLKTNKRVL